MRKRIYQQLAHGNLQLLGTEVSKPTDEVVRNGTKIYIGEHPRIQLLKTYKSNVLVNYISSSRLVTSIITLSGVSMRLADLEVSSSRHDQVQSLFQLAMPRHPMVTHAHLVMAERWGSQTASRLRIGGKHLPTCSHHFPTKVLNDSDQACLFSLKVPRTKHFCQVPQNLKYYIFT